jgi:hypothetical protein
MNCGSPVNGRPSHGELLVLRPSEVVEAPEGHVSRGEAVQAHVLAARFFLRVAGEHGSRGVQAFGAAAGLARVVRGDCVQGQSQEGQGRRVKP